MDNRTILRAVKTAQGAGSGRGGQRAPGVAGQSMRPRGLSKGRRVQKTIGTDHQQSSVSVGGSFAADQNTGTEVTKAKECVTVKTKIEEWLQKFKEEAEAKKSNKEYLFEAVLEHVQNFKRVPLELEVTRGNLAYALEKLNLGYDSMIMTEFEKEVAEGIISPCDRLLRAPAESSTTGTLSRKRCLEAVQKSPSSSSSSKVETEELAPKKKSRLMNK